MFKFYFLVATSVFILCLLYLIYLKWSLTREKYLGSFLALTIGALVWSLGIRGRKDQLFEVGELLRRDPESRRAVISLFDGDRDDLLNSPDVPCCIAVHFMIRDGKLDCHTFSRSMDIMWGSAINFYEWTALQEMLAYWLGCDMGTYSHFVSSLHLYKRHYRRARRIVGQIVEPTHGFTRIEIEQNAFSQTMRELAEFSIGVCVDPLLEFDASDKWTSEVTSILRSHAFASAGDFTSAGAVLSDLAETDILRLAIQNIDTRARALQT